MITSPALLAHRQDLLAADLLGRPMDSDIHADGAARPNFARFTFSAAPPAFPRTGTSPPR